MPGIRFNETMDGYLGEGIGDFRDGEDYGIRHGNGVRFDVRIEIKSVDEFISISSHEAKLTGRFYCSAIADDRPLNIRRGRFNLFDIDPTTGHRTMRYEFIFIGPDGSPYCFTGHKDVYNDRGLDLFDDMTTLFVRIYQGENKDGALFGSGVMYFRIKDPASLTKMIMSSEVTDSANFFETYVTLTKFAAFFVGETIETYAPTPRFHYSTRYENLVLSGTLTEKGDSTPKEFFFFSGEHDKGFPWGDEETMSDVALLISDGQGGFTRYGITRQSLKGLDVRLAGNSYTYTGELYRINDGHEVSFSEISAYAPGGRIEKVTARIRLTLDVEQYNSRVAMSFKPIEHLAGIIPDEVEEEVRSYLQHFPLMGYFTTPYRVTVNKGTISIAAAGETITYAVDPNTTYGEGELGELNNPKEPTLYYNYICGIDPARQTIYLRIDSGTLRNEREQYLKDIIDKAIGKAIQRDVKKNLILERAIKANPVRPSVVKDDLLTLVNDHYPTGVFLRRIVRVQNNGQTFLGLEEYMDAINLAPMNSDKETTVAVATYAKADAWDGSAPDDEDVRAVYESDEKFVILDQVIADSGFFETLEKALAESGKSREDFSIAIKPNFMFFYSDEDKSTFTDAALVQHLAKRIYEEGFHTIKICEARSTLSVFFDKRDVKSVARYLGYDEGGKYTVVDLSDDLEAWDYGGKLGRHYVNREWKAADFRISFAKNKTHSYAYYTLTIKNIYGALPMEHKFKVYHCDMGDIYEPTIDYLRAFPVHFGFIDAVVGADGPFGIFADPYPQLTQTIIAGEDLVAVDWVGAAKMGIDPMLSRYMQEAIKAFGKPRIRVKGDSRLYRFWANTPRLASKGSHLLDRHYTFGYPIYYIMSAMDPAFPVKPAESEFLTALRPLFERARDVFFKDPYNPPSWLHEAVNKIIFRLWQ